MKDLEQEEAARYINGHSLIIAGAGCGKTTTLLKKINYMIENNVNERDILVISFTNETVNNFKNKSKYNIDVYTFHKLGLLFSKNEKEIIDENIIDKIIEEIIRNINSKMLKIIYKYIGTKYKKDPDHNIIINYLKSICKIIKTNNIDIDKLSSSKFSQKEIIILFVCKKIIEIYSKELSENGLIDFDDMIINATYNLKNKLISHNYKYILVDEYQDISKIRLEFLIEIINANNSILTAVGDDWQSIYGFSGSDIKLFYEFKKYFTKSKIFKITTTYRCPKKLIKISENFITKNKLQIKKSLKTINNDKCEYKKIYSNNLKKTFDKIISKIVSKNETTLILSRNNYDIDSYISKKYKIINSFLYINNIKYENIRFMTIHKSKGLEADNIILLNLKNNINGLPSLKSNILIEKLLDTKEPIKYAEERRIMYVALTRAKKNLYIIVHSKSPSKFIKEI